jgi:hypothetical protein
MSAPVTKIVANVTRHETVVYFIEGAVDHSCAAQLIESGEYDPDDSYGPFTRAEMEAAANPRRNWYTLAELRALQAAGIEVRS